MDLNFPIFNGRTIITLNQFLTNPTGKGSSMMAKREEVRKNLEKRYSNILKKTGGKLNYTVYIDGDSYFFYFKIPSETFDNLLYDVVLEFLPENKKMSKFQTLEDYSINFFSNSPHMTFTYTYVLKENKITVPFCESMFKYSKTALKQKPKVTNPIRIFGFEKTCYYAALYIDRNKLTVKSEIEKNATRIDKNTRVNLINQIKTQDQKLAEYNALKKKISDEKKKAKVKNLNKKNVSNYNKAVADRKKRKAKSGFKSMFDKKKK